MADSDEQQTTPPPMSGERLEALRQALDEAVLMHTGRSIGDLASSSVLADIMPALEALHNDLLAEVERLRAKLAAIILPTEPTGDVYVNGKRYLYADSNNVQVIQQDNEPEAPDHEHEWQSIPGRHETLPNGGSRKVYRTRCIRCGVVWEHS